MPFLDQSKVKPRYRSEQKMQLKLNPNQLKYWRLVAALLAVKRVIPRPTISDLSRYALRLVERENPDECREALEASHNTEG